MFSFKTRILHKGLLIVLLPLSINAFLIGLLNNSLDRAAQLMESSRRQSIVINTLSHEILTVTGILTSGNNAMMNGTYNYFGRFIDEYLTSLQAGLSEIAAQMPLDHNFEETRREIIELIATQRSIFIKAEDKSMLADDLIVKLRRTSGWIRLCGRESVLLNKVLDGAQEKFKRSVLSRHREENLTEAIVLSALIVNGILACFLAVYFHRHIANRIGGLIAIARKLPSHEPITENIGGADELSELAAVLRQVGLELTEADEYRSTLMQMMAHDVRSPVTGAGMLAEILESQNAGQLTEAGAKNLKIAKDSIAECLTIISDLLLLERLETGKLELDVDVYDIKAVVASAIARQKQSAAAASIELVNAVESIKLQCDHDYISMAVQRLLQRAIVESPQGSRVEVTTRRNTSLRVCIKDCGKPFSQSVTEHLFDKFYQVVESQSQTDLGLGLALAREIVLAHKGAIGAESSERGNTLWFEIPLPEGA